MSTKINVRSPFYIGYAAPVAPTPEFVAATANLTNFTVNEAGTIGLPDLDFGVIVDIDSNDSDFADESFPTVTSDTNRTVIFYVEVPAGFSNEGDVIQIEATALQSAISVSCAAVVSATGASLAFNLDTGGASAALNIGNHFTGTGTVDEYSVQHYHPTAMDVVISQNGLLVITSKNTAGTFTGTITAYDHETGCTANKVFTVTLTSQVTFDANTANALGGEVQPDGTIINPSVIGTITTIRFSPTGGGQTSYFANDTGSSRNVTLYFDITVPNGYSNAGATVQINKTFVQEAQNVTPTFDVDTVDFDDQAILTTGQVIAGTAQDNNGTNVVIQSFSPTSFDTVTSTTSRDVTFTVVIPSGYQNAGTTVTKVLTLDQPPTNIFELQPCTGATTKVYIGIINNFTINPNGNPGYVMSEGTGSFDANWRPFRDNFVHYGKYEAFIAVDNIFQLKGQHICVGGSPMGVKYPRGNEVTYINTYKTFPNTTAAQDPIEYYITFDTSRLVKHLYRKDWVSRTIEKIF